MSILNIRIDERLIHGQVATVWTNQLNITRILVIDDLAAVDDIQKIPLIHSQCGTRGSAIK